MDSIQSALLVPEELQRILSSPEFSRSERPSRFLRFVVEQTLAGKADQLKETVIGIEVFGRKPDYDPHSDPVVRVEAAKLRSRLAEYYNASGLNDFLRIEIPKGGYVPQWRAVRPPRSQFRWKLGLAFGLAICLAIVGFLRLKDGAFIKANASSSRAFELYMRGRAALDGRTGRTATALQYFEEALRQSPSDALIYAGYADALLMMDQEHRMVHEEAFSRAKSAAEKAIQLNPRLSEGYSVLGVVRVHERRWAEAEQILRRAIELNPDNALAHAQLGFQLLLPERRWDEAINELRRAVSLEPLSSGTNLQLAYGLLWARRFEEAEDEARKSIALDPDGVDSYSILGQALYWRQNNTDALVALQQGVERSQWGGGDAWLACGQVRAGNRKEALHVLADNLPGGHRTNVPDRRLLMMYACLGDREHAFESLETMYAKGEPDIPLFMLYPELDWLRTDSRFGAMLKKIGLAEEGASSVARLN